MLCINRSHVDYLRRENVQAVATTPRMQFHIPLRSLHRFWEHFGRGLDRVDAVEIAGNLSVDLLRSVAFSIYTLEGICQIYLICSNHEYINGYFFFLILGRLNGIENYVENFELDPEQNGNEEDIPLPPFNDPAVQEPQLNGYFMLLKIPQSLFSY